MPYFYDPNLDQEQKNKQKEIQISGSSPTSNAQGQSISSGPSYKDVNTGSGFQNLDKYLQANQGSDFGKQVLGKVGETVGKGEKALSDTQEQFGQRVTDLSKTPSQEEISRAIEKPGEADKEKFHEYLTQQYKGPRSVTETEDLYKQRHGALQQAQQEGKALESEGGRYTLLDKYFGRPGYNPGMKKLDSLIYEQTRPVEQEKNLQQAAQNLQGKQSAQDIELSNLASKKYGEVESSREAARKAIGLGEHGEILEGEKAGALGKQYDLAQKQIEAKNKEKEARFKALKDYLSKGEIPEKDLVDLGLIPFEGSSLRGVNPGDFLEQTPELTREQAIDQKDRDYLRALEDLAGAGHKYGEKAPEPAKDYRFRKDQFADELRNRQFESQRAYDEMPVEVDGNTITRPQAVAKLEELQRESSAQEAIHRDPTQRILIAQAYQRKIQELARQINAAEANFKSQEKLGQTFKVRGGG